jgi:hypothetical protein
MSRFDFGICMAAFDCKQTIQTAEFDRDARVHSFTLYRADNQAQVKYSLTRFEKITAGRYKGWFLGVPSEFEAYARDHTFRRHWYRDCGKASMAKVFLKPKERAAANL